MDSDGCEHVLGYRFGRESADIVDRFSSDQRAASDEVSGIPVIPSRLNEGEEEVLLSPDIFLLAVHAMLKGVDVVKFLRRLSKGDLIVLEVADEAVDEMGERCMIRVEDGDELGLGMLEGVIEIPRFCILMGGSRYVYASELLAEFLDLLALSVIEHEGAVWVCEIVAGEKGFP